MTWVVVAGFVCGGLAFCSAVTQAEPTPYRTLMAYFEEGGDSEKPKQLTTKRSYRLVVVIGSSAGGKPGPSSILTQQGIPVNVVVRCGFCSADQLRQVASVRLGVTREAKAEFEVAPRRAGTDRIVVTIERDDQIVTSMVLPVEVGRRGGSAPGSVQVKGGGLRLLREAAFLSTADTVRTLAAGAVASMDPTWRPRAVALPELNALKAELVIEIDVNSARIVMKGPVVGATFGAKTQEVSGDALSRADLQRLLIDAYNRLYAVLRQETVRLKFSDTSDGPLGHVQLEEVTKQEILFEFAVLGSDMYRTLFSHSPRLLKVLRKLREIPGAPRIYIKTAGAFLPWALIYDASRGSVAPGRVEVDGFWGSRYAVVGVPMLEEAQPTTRALGDDRYRMVVGYYSGQEAPFPTYRDDQRKYFASSGSRFEVTETLNEDDFLNGLKETAGSIGMIYVFAHGKGGVQRIQARLVDENRIIEFSRPDPSDAAIRLSPMSSRRSGLTPSDILSLNIDDRRLAQPLVFLNVCEGAATAEISQANFVTAFFNVGAGAVIATDAEVLQAMAAHFARSLFAELQGPASHTSLADIMLRLRRRYLAINPLVYTYTLWGDGAVVPPR